jgi:hypothetical protein
MQRRYTKASTKVIFFHRQFSQSFTLTALSHLQHGRFAITLLTDAKAHCSTAGLTGLASRSVSVVANSLIKVQFRSFFREQGPVGLRNALEGKQHDVQKQIVRVRNQTSKNTDRQTEPSSREIR